MAMGWTVRATERRGSAASDKQVHRAVKEWQKIIFFPQMGPTVEGWVIGLDDYHWVVFDTHGHTVLVHKSCPSLRITDVEPEALGEPKATKIREAGEPFRNHVLSEHFGQDQPRSAAS